MKPKIVIKRVYEPAAASDGIRVLVDRLWPRGLRKEAVPLNLWLKDIAPSTELRKWYGHEPERWPQFKSKYEAELTAHTEAIADLVRLARKTTVTLLYAARDGERSNAEVLRQMIAKQAAKATK